MQVLAAAALRVEGERVAGGQGHGGHLGQFVADLDRGVARADDHDAFAGVLVWAAVAGHVQQPPGEAVLAGQGRQVGVPNEPVAATTPAAWIVRPVAVWTRNPPWPWASTAVTGVRVRMSAPRLSA